MTTHVRVDNPANGEIVAEIPYLSLEEARIAINKASTAQREWSQTPISMRVKAIEKFVEALKKMAPEVALDISRQMGKPLHHANGEIGGTIQRARHMARIAEEVLGEEVLPEMDGFYRSISREPVGIVFDIAAWNYPLLVAVNAVIPAVLAGNAVLIKHSPRTPLCGLHFERAFHEAGFPAGLVQSTLVTHDTAAAVISDQRIGAVSFVGSTRGGREVLQAAAKHRFIEVGLELGGKDPAYVGADSELDFSVPNVMEGAFFNAGQSCCAIERVYVHEDVYDSFVEKAVAEVSAYVQGDPMDPKTFLGPMALPDASNQLKRQVDDAVSRGATLLCGGDALQGPGRYFSPTLLTGVNHTMTVMTEESFGPILGIQKVRDDNEALGLMNDSTYGLTASVWTQDATKAEWFASRLQTGTVFMNRCDYLDPEQPWTGVKNTGRGVTLSRHGFDSFTRFKNRHFRLNKP